MKYLHLNQDHHHQNLLHLINTSWDFLLIFQNLLFPHQSAHRRWFGLLIHRIVQAIANFTFHWYYLLLLTFVNLMNQLSYWNLFHFYSVHFLQYDLELFLFLFMLLYFVLIFDRFSIEEFSMLRFWAKKLTFVHNVHFKDRNRFVQ